MCFRPWVQMMMDPSDTAPGLDSRQRRALFDTAMDDGITASTGSAFATVSGSAFATACSRTTGARATHEWPGAFLNPLAVGTGSRPTSMGKVTRTDSEPRADAFDDGNTNRLGLECGC